MKRRRGALRLHPSRVLRFLGNELPDPSLGLSVWSDSILQTLYDAIHAVALTTTGATSLMHEAKVDVVTCRTSPSTWRARRRPRSSLPASPCVRRMSATA